LPPQFLVIIHPKQGISASCKQGMIIINIWLQMTFSLVQIILEPIPTKTKSIVTKSNGNEIICEVIINISHVINHVKRLYLVNWCMFSIIVQPNHQFCFVGSFFLLKVGFFFKKKLNLKYVVLHYMVISIFLLNHGYWKVLCTFENNYSVKTCTTTNIWMCDLSKSFQSMK
jgi:hypothetical protein